MNTPYFQGALLVATPAKLRQHAHAEMWNRGILEQQHQLHRDSSTEGTTGNWSTTNRWNVRIDTTNPLYNVGIEGIRITLSVTQGVGNSEGIRHQCHDDCFVSLGQGDCWGSEIGKCYWLLSTGHQKVGSLIFPVIAWVCSESCWHWRQRCREPTVLRLWTLLYPVA